MAFSKIRALTVVYAKSMVGLDANPSDPICSQKYLDLIGPGETAESQSSMGAMSGCGLVVAGIWRGVGLRSSQLYPPYVSGTALSRLMQIAYDADAWVDYSANASPLPGDMVLVGDGTNTVQHVYTVLTVHPDGEGGYTLTSVDGGQVDAEGYQCIEQKSRIWQDGNDIEPNGTTRPIQGWVDIQKLPFGEPPLYGYVQDAPPCVLGFDTDTALDKSSAASLYQAGYRFCLRYLSLQSPEAEGDLSRSEAQAILDAGLALMAVQHVDAAGWTPSTSLGQAHGEAAAANALEVGLPIGVNVWLDLEGVAEGCSANDVIDYCQAWYSEVVGAGFSPGLYVGASAGLNGTQLYEDLSFAHYWQSMSDVPVVATRGYQMVQSDSCTVSGIAIDPDNTQNDNLGGQVMWIVKTPLVTA